jgi:PAS domain S-box-containing protein
MKDKSKTKSQLAEELAEMRRRVAALEKSEIDRKQAEEIYKTLAESSLAAVFIVQGGIFRFINTSAAAYVGYTPEELIGRNSDMIVHPEDREMVKRKGREILRGEDTTPYEFRMVTKEGQIRWIMQIVTPIEYEGKPAILGNAIDITERKGAEELYKTLAESSLAAVFIIQDGKFRFVNTTAMADIGYTPEELIGKDADCFIHPEDKEAVAIKTRAMLKAKDPTPYEYRIVTKQGQIMWVMQTSTYIHYEGKTAILGNAMDITEHKRAEEALRESEDKFRILTEKAIVGVYLIQDGVFKYVNPRGADILGYTVDELTMKPPKDFVAPEDWPMVREYFRQRLSGEVDSLHYELKMVKKGGEVIIVEAYGSQIIYNGQLAILGTLLDISDRKRAEEEQLHREKLQSILEMAGAICHEMNQPMQIISGYSELLLKNISENDPIHGKLDMIHKQTQRMGSITRKLMKIKEYQTQDYAGVSRIIDINKSSGKDAE